MSVFFTGANAHFQNFFKSLGFPVIETPPKLIDNKNQVEFTTKVFETADNKSIKISIAASFSRLRASSVQTNSKQKLVSNKSKLPLHIEQCVQEIISALLIKIIKSMMIDDIVLLDFVFIDLLVDILSSELNQRDVKLQSILLKEVTILYGPDGDTTIPILIDFNPDNHRESDCVVWPTDSRCLARVNIVSTCPDETYVCIGNEGVRPSLAEPRVNCSETDKMIKTQNISNEEHQETKDYMKENAPSWNRNFRLRYHFVLYMYSRYVSAVNEEESSLE